MENKRERITSLRKVIAEKKVRLGVNSDVLYLKGLRKYNNLADLKYPKSLSPYKYTYINDKKGRFNIVKYNKTLDINKHDYVYSKIVKEVSKKVLMDFNENLDGLNEREVVDFVNSYIKENTSLKGLSIEVVENESIIDFAKYAIKRHDKGEPKYIFKMNELNTDGRKCQAYTVVDLMLSSKVDNRRFLGRDIYSGIEVAFHDLVSYIAKGMISKIVGDYLENNEDSRKDIQSCINDIVVEYDLDTFNLLTSDFISEALEDNQGYMINFIKTVIVITMERLLRNSFEIYEYSKRIEETSKNYARTYMTKKNIPQKTLDYMKNNKFLTMFGFVEADELCEIKKLELLSEELLELSDKMFLPKVKNHSLRFRRLGKLKASGVYYPSFKTLALDIDEASSFIHELMHLIDFENGILSLDKEFKPLLYKYIELMDKKFEEKSKGKDTSASDFSNKNSKYNRSYYASNEEAFARMGEMYVTEILNIETSLAKENYKGGLLEIVYPMDSELLGMIKEYYSKVFDMLKDNFEGVDREDSSEFNGEEIFPVKNDLEYKSVSDYFKSTDEVVTETSQMSFF